MAKLMEKKKRIAFVFTQGPHGNSAGREGLDALLATSALSEDLGVFFISDGVLQLLPQQQPEKFSPETILPLSVSYPCTMSRIVISAKPHCSNAD